MKTARNVNLTPHLAEFVDRNVAMGRFQNASEVVREALRAFERVQQEDDLKLEVLGQAVAQGRDDAAHGRLAAVEPGGLAAYLSTLGRGEPT